MNCLIPECKEIKRSKGYCYAHYYGFKKYGNPLYIKKKGRPLSLKVRKNILYIELTNGEFALADSCDYEKVKQYRWSKAGRGYAYGGNEKEQFMKMHRIITGAKDGEIVDHINRNKLDNRRKNLRIVSQSINALNGSIRSNSKTKVKGVCRWWRTGNWRAYAVINNKQKHLGYFEKIQDAIRARQNFNKLMGVT